MGGIVGALTGLALVGSVTSNSDYQTSLIAQTVPETAATISTPPAEPTSNNDLDNARNTLKWDKENYQNRSNELKNNFKGQDLTSLNNLMGQWSALLTQMESAVNSGDTAVFNDINSQGDDLSRDVSDAFTAAYDESNLVNNKNQALKEKPRQLKDIERQLKDLQRNSRKMQPAPDTSILQGYLTQLQDLISKMQTLANTPVGTTDARDLSDGISDLVRDFDDTSQDFYNTINELNEKVNSASQLENSQKNLKDKTRTAKDLSREIKRLSKNISQEQLQALSTMEQEMNAILAQIQSALTAGDIDTLNDLDRDFWDKNTEAQDLLNESREVENRASQSKDMNRIIKEKTRNIKDMTRECTRVKCEDTDAGAVLKQLEDLLGQMTSMATNSTADFAVEDFWDLNSEFDNLNGEFWPAVETKRSEKDIRRWLKDTAREVKDKGRWVADLEREAKRGQSPFTASDVSELQNVYQQMEDAAKRADSSYGSGDYETAREILELELNDLRMQFDTITNGLNDSRETEFFEFELERINNELVNAEEKINELLAEGGIDSQKADLCLGYVDQGYEFYQELKTIRETGKVGASEEVEARFEQLGNQADRDCGEFFVEDGNDYHSFTEVYVDEEFRGTADEVFAGLSDEIVSRVVEKLLDKNTSILNSIFEKASARFESEISRSFEALSYVPEDYQEEFLSRKETILQQLDEMDRQIANKTRELEALQSKIAGYNFIGNAGDEIEERIQSKLEGGLTPEEEKQLAREVDETILRNRSEKFENGVIPFHDVDDNEWFYGFVSEAKNRGVVSGRGDKPGYFDPAAKVSAAEILKMTLEAVGNGESEGEPELRQAQNHWSRGYVKNAEEMGLRLIQGLNDLNRAATRAEVIQVILETMGIEPENVGNSSFSDVADNHPALGYIEKAKNLGLVSGDSGKNTVRPNDSINRAEAAKIINKAISLMETAEPEEPEDMDETGDSTGIFE